MITSWAKRQLPRASSRLWNEPRHEISNNVICATSKDSDQPGHTRSLIRAFSSRLNFKRVLCYWLNIILSVQALKETAQARLSWPSKRFCIRRFLVLLSLSHKVVWVRCDTNCIDSWHLHSSLLFILTRVPTHKKYRILCYPLRSNSGWLPIRCAYFILVYNLNSCMSCFQNYLLLAEKDKARYIQEMKQFQNSEHYQNYLKKKKSGIIWCKLNLSNILQVFCYPPTNLEGYSFGVVLPYVRPHFLSVRNHISVPIGQIWFILGTND